MKGRIHGRVAVPLQLERLDPTVGGKGGPETHLERREYPGGPPLAEQGDRDLAAIDVLLDQRFSVDATDLGYPLTQLSRIVDDRSQVDPGAAARVRWLDDQRESLSQGRIDAVLGRPDRLEHWGRHPGLAKSVLERDLAVREPVELGPRAAVREATTLQRLDDLHPGHAVTPGPVPLTQIEYDVTIQGVHDALDTAEVDESPRGLESSGVEGIHQNTVSVVGALVRGVLVAASGVRRIRIGQEHHDLQSAPRERAGLQRGEPRPGAPNGRKRPPRLHGGVMGPLAHPRSGSAGTDRAEGAPNECISADRRTPTLRGWQTAPLRRAGGGSGGHR